MYRIVTEAVTNVVRHAGAAQCWLRIRTGDLVEIEVVDDGVGIAAAAPGGVGLTAMHERASPSSAAPCVSCPTAPTAHECMCNYPPHCHDLRSPATQAVAGRSLAGARSLASPGHIAVSELRVAIVDDHPMFRLGLAAAIREMSGVELVGEASRADAVERPRRRHRARR